MNAAFVLPNELCNEFRKPSIEVVPEGEVEAMLSAMSIELSLFDEIKEKQQVDEWLSKIREIKEKGEAQGFEIDGNGTIKYKGRWCIPKDPLLKRRILQEAHNTPYSIHAGGGKLYKDLKQQFWWPGMKKEVATFVSKCMTCQKVKAEHRRPGDLLQPLEVHRWK